MVFCVNSGAISTYYMAFQYPQGQGYFPSLIEYIYHYVTRHEMRRDSKVLTLFCRFLIC
jgi:hypothetical protein